MNTAACLLRSGYVGTPDALVQVRELVGDPHSGAGGRAYACTVAGGLHFEVLPERGLDLGAVWYAGQPVAWRSPLGSPGLAPTPAGWLGRFGGGLLVTCGLDNIGAPRGGYGQHGSHHATRAYDVAVTRTLRDGVPGVRITGTIDSAEVFGRRVRVYRVIESWADDPALHLTDRVANEGAWAAPAALLYHVNFGAPLVLPGTRITVPAAQVVQREARDFGDDPRCYPEPIDRVDEVVWRYDGLVTTDGYAQAAVTSPTGLAATLRWRAAELPLAYEWVFPPRGTWALGLEPANAPLWGPDRAGEDAGAPVLQPGEAFETALTIRCSLSTPDTSR